MKSFRLFVFIIILGGRYQFLLSCIHQVIDFLMNVSFSYDPWKLGDQQMSIDAIKDPFIHEVEIHNYDQYVEDGSRDIGLHVVLPISLFKLLGILKFERAHFYL